jgi:hypothetical protein
MKKDLCKVCKLKDNCLEFDYECIEASDFMYGFDITTYNKMLSKKINSIVFRVNDTYINSLIDKKHIALRG